MNGAVKSQINRGREKKIEKKLENGFCSVGNGREEERRAAAAGVCQKQMRWMPATGAGQLLFAI